MKENEISRRDFVKLVTKGATGAVISRTVLPLGVGEVNAHVTKAVYHTLNENGIKAGNAGNEEAIKLEAEKACDTSVSPELCVNEYSPKTDLVRQLGDAFTEEIIFRFIPSAVFDLMSSKGHFLDRCDKVAHNAYFGNDKLDFDTKEKCAALLTSGIFAALHNITSKGFDTKTLPATQFMGGIVMWYLQRRLGISSNTLAHFWHNIRVD